MKIAIVILHYKNIKDTIACLHSVNKLKVDNQLIKIILVNNDKNSNLKTQISNINLKTKILIINNQKNLGFAAGINMGIKEVLHDKNVSHILILNNDTIIPPNLLNELIKERGDIVAPVIKFKSIDNRWVYDFGGRINWVTGRTSHLECNNITIKQYNNERKIDYVSGCCMLVKREVFEKIGLFDERYFFYYEDTDFCVRAKKEGYRISVCPKIVIFHKLGGSIGRWTRKAIYYNLKSNFIFITKHLGWNRPVGYLYLMILSLKIFINKIINK